MTSQAKTTATVPDGTTTGAPSRDDLEQDANNTTSQSVEPTALLARAAKLVIDKQNASTSLVQRHLGVDYNKAAGLMESLEELGVVTSADLVQSRKVVVTEMPRSLRLAAAANKTVTTPDAARAGDAHITDQSRFLSNVRDHHMTIEIDNGVHRCIRFARSGSSADHFRLVTWPGHLAISGDCEPYTFARLPDMFEFFRGDRINLPYWAEKLQSPARNDIYKAFSKQRFTDAIRVGFDEWVFPDDATRQKSLSYLTCEWDGLIAAPPHDMREAMQAAMEYKCPATGQWFSDFYDNRIWDYSYHFAWSCRAIQWGIKRFDQAKDGRTQSDHDARVLAGAI